MKRSLPVIAGIGVVLVLALLIGGGFLELPSIGGDAGAEEPGLPEPAPLVDPEPLDVAYGDDANDTEKKQDKDKKNKDGDRKRKGDGKNRRGRKNGDSQGRGGADTRKAPSLRNRNGDKKQGGVEPKGNDREPTTDPQPKDPNPVYVTDLRGDPEGEGQAPSYIDLESVALQASGDIFVAELTFAGRLPSKMPDDGMATLASIEVDRGNRRLSVYAEASDDGWRAHTNRSSDFPGSLEIDGRTMRFTIARSFFGNEFAWYAHSSWTKSTATNTEYFFDFAPDDQNGRFPSGGTT